jgi:hypothetical protein
LIEDELDSVRMVRRYAVENRTSTSLVFVERCPAPKEPFLLAGHYQQVSWAHFGEEPPSYFLQDLASE